jgi:aspartyl-tRNA(Asn)/glutamyl-tRNA(Gln) amidotransferase subunit A
MYGDDIVFLPVRELGKRLKAKQISSVELTETYLDRLEKFGPKYNCVVAITKDRAMTEARAADAEIGRGKYRGPLHGIPYGVKDLLAAEGYNTTFGAAPYRDQKFDKDSTVVARLKNAGAVLVAKLAMVELAGGMGYQQANASFTGPGLTPWNTKYWSGGSSSGPGSATSAALVAFAIGSETNGSIMAPSTFCGITGLRPTYGRVSRHGGMALSYTMDKLGPMCRTADDCGLVLDAIAGADPLDPTCVDRLYKYEPLPAGGRRGGKRWRVGVLKDAATNAHPDVKKNFEASLEVIKQFADVVPDLELPNLPWGVISGIMVGAEGAAAFDDLFENGGIATLTDPACRYNGYSGVVVLAKDYIKAMRQRRTMSTQFDALLKQVDAIAHPTRTTPAPYADRLFRESYTEVRGPSPALGSAENVCGTPGIGLPNGFASTADNLPTGIQFSARAFDENVVLQLAQEYQKRTDWHTKRPPVTA